MCGKCIPDRGNSLDKVLTGSPLGVSEEKKAPREQGGADDPSPIPQGDNDLTGNWALTRKKG